MSNVEYNIAVVDDRRIDSEVLRRKINKWFNDNYDTSRNVICFPNGEELLKNFEPEKFQIIFMDILMDSSNGIEIAKKLRASDNRALIVFVTSSNEFALEAFPVHPFDYVLKPYDSERLGSVLRDAVNFIEIPEPSITVKVSRTQYKIKVKNISAVLSSDHAVEIVMTAGNSMLCSMKFKDFEEILKDFPQFLYCNRGLIINMDCVLSLSRNKDAFIMKDGQHYAVKVKERSKIISAFTQYQISKMRGIFVK